MQTEILVTHPYKHHALNLAAGCARSGRTTAFALPFYRSGLGAAVARLPGAIGRKAGGYFHAGLEGVQVVQSPSWQLRKLRSFLGDPRSIEVPYDHYVSRQLLAGRWRARMVVTLQDHMPLTSAAARYLGAVLWSDQIINSSAEARARIVAHSPAGVSSDILQYPEDANTRILAMADIVTAPSEYTLRGIRGRIGDRAQLHCVPYGVDTQRFDVPHAGDAGTFTIVARANTLRKGGSLLLDAILRSHGRWAALVHPRRLQFVFLGRCAPPLARQFERLRNLDDISVRDGEIPNADVPGLFARADLFLMPTLSESMSLACVEAMRAGLPLVITEYAGIDCFVHGEMGLLVTDTVESIEAAITEALGNPSRLAQWRVRAREAAHALTWDRYERSIADIAAGSVS